MNKKHIAFAVSVVSLLLGLSACNKSDNNWYANIEGETVATVNGVELKRAELDVLQKTLSNSGRETMPEDKVIEELVSMELLRQEALNHGLDKDPKISIQLNRQVTQVLVTALLQKQVTNAEVNDEEIELEYQAQLSIIPTTEYKSRHILVEKEEEAKAIIADLNKGADFIELAKEKSRGPSGKKGGDLGWSVSTSFVPPFSNAMQDLTPGTYSSEPVKTQFGWHIILLEDKRSTTPPKLEDIKPRIKQIVINKRAQDFVKDLREKANVTVNSTVSDKGETVTDS